MAQLPNSFKYGLQKLILVLGLLVAGTEARAQFSKNITLEGFLPYDTCLSALWGYTDLQGREYALVGTCSGTSIVDITVPGQPVEKYFVPGPASIWREIKTWSHYAYIVTEGGGGLTIVDLANLPDTNLTYAVYSNTGAGTFIINAHTLWIDEKGRCFLYGALGYGPGPAGSTPGLADSYVVLDLTADPMNPQLIGTKGGIYYHDGYVRHDTLWASAIWAGFLEIYDVADPTDPQFLGTCYTPGYYTHNAWPSDDGKTVFTTDEVPDGYITALDISNPHMIFERDRVQMDPAGNETPHNVHYLNGWLPTAYYREGAVIVDAHRPDNLVITGYYDTHWPDTGSNSFEGVWEVYPYFPSGRMIAGDRAKGLYILKPEYVRACYLEGTVSDTVTGYGIPGASVFFSGLLPGEELSTRIDGIYLTGAADSGLYQVTYAKAGYESKTFYVTLTPGEVLHRDVALRPVGYELPSPPGDFSDLQVWPVPAHSTLEIYGIPYTVTEVQVVDVNGKTLLTRRLNQQAYAAFDVSALAAGDYFLFFRQGKKKPHIHRLLITR